MKKRIVVGVSGASGFVLAIDLMKALKKHSDIERHLVMSRGAELTMSMEFDNSMELSNSMEPEAAKSKAMQRLEHLADRVYDINDIGASIASGTFKTDGMIVIPCSMKTLAGINCGFSDNLLLRAADVTIKERRKLILVVRETPLSPIHLKNMLELSRMGVDIMPAMMSFYNSMTTAEDMRQHLIGKILDGFELEHVGYRRWDGPECRL